MDALIISVYAMEAKEGKIKIPRNTTADFDAERERGELLSRYEGHTSYHPQHLGCEYCAEYIPWILCQIINPENSFVDVI